MRDHPHDYILENTTIDKLTLSDLLAHTTDSINTAKRAFFDIQAETIELNTGFFTNTSPVIDFPLVSVTQLHNTIILSCPCKAIKKKLCEHQVQVLFNIIEQPYLRVFYDTKLRQQNLKEFAKEYGLENEADLDDFFEIEDVLPEEMKIKYQLIFTPMDGLPEDEIVLGYMPISKL